MKDNEVDKKKEKQYSLGKLAFKKAAQKSEDHLPLQLRKNDIKRF